MFKKIRYWYRNVFVFSKTESNASVLMIFLMIIMFIIPPLIKKINYSNLDESYTDHAILNSMIDEWNQSHNSENKLAQSPDLIEYTFFDPNDVSKETLLAFGISDKVAGRIINYRNKGGKFIIKEDLMRVYDFPQQKYEELYPYISLPETKAAPVKVAPKEKKENKFTPNKKNIISTEFDINKADTNQLKTIKGIGTVLSSRIIKYRDNLGGFISKDQLQEIWGIEEQVLLQLINTTIISADFEPNKIDINNADVKELSSHPYITKKLAERIVSYRDHHGDYNEETRLNNIKELDDQTKEQIYPYLKY